MYIERAAPESVLASPRKHLMMWLILFFPTAVNLSLGNNVHDADLIQILEIE